MRAPDRDSATTAGLRLLLLGLALSWIGFAATWPEGLSFQDEIGYAGGARLLLEGGVRPGPDTVSIWIPTAHGRISKYPLLPSLPLIPFYATVPAAAPLWTIFALGLLCLLAGRVLASWGVSPVWALLVAAHPTFVLLARTVMPDIPLALAALAAFRVLRRDRRLLAVPAFAALVALKPTGIVLAVPIVLGEALRRRRGPDARARVRMLAPAAAGIAAGLVVTAALNVLQTASVAYAYARTAGGAPPFALGHLLHTGPVLLLALVCLPPGLVAGLIPWWRRGEWGAVLPTVTLAGLMAVYFYVDRGRGGFDTLAFAERLVLPAVAFLLIGYAELLARLANRLGARRWIGAALVLAAPLSTVAIGISHRHWQDPMAEARQMAEARLSAAGGGALGLTYGAFKAGMTTRARVRWVPRSTVPRVVLCSTEIPTYHTDYAPPRPCDLPGYRQVGRVGSYVVLEK